MTAHWNFSSEDTWRKRRLTDVLVVLVSNFLTSAEWLQSGDCRRTFWHSHQRSSSKAPTMRMQQTRRQQTTKQHKRYAWKTRKIHSFTMVNNCLIAMLIYNTCIYFWKLKGCFESRYFQERTIRVILQTNLETSWKVWHRRIFHRYSSGPYQKPPSLLQLIWTVLSKVFLACFHLWTARTGDRVPISRLGNISVALLILEICWIEILEICYSFARFIACSSSS